MARDPAYHPQQQIIWHGQGTHSTPIRGRTLDNFSLGNFAAQGGSWSYFQALGQLANNLVYSTRGPFMDQHGNSMSDKNYTSWVFSSAKVWHDFDAAIGIDINAPQ